MDSFSQIRVKHKNGVAANKMFRVQAQVTFIDCQNKTWRRLRVRLKLLLFHNVPDSYRHGNGNDHLRSVMARGYTNTEESFTN